MSSVIEGYSYDIFISYRQKDNRGEKWVSEFVEALKIELESTFKEEISVYFDINPHDGLLETHDVDETLKKKLKCLICIPVISRTYCDPKSFAWKNEFQAFIDLAGSDMFGLRITLPGGNVASRILPVRIHDLDPEDIRLFESTIGGALRGVDFVYKETGVNRQLRAKDDDIIKSPGQLLYRDQINKVALAVKDIIEGMISAASHEVLLGKENSAGEKSGQKVIQPEASAGMEAGEKKIKSPSGKEKMQRITSARARLILPFIIFCLAAGTGAYLFLNHRAKARWVSEKALPGIKKLYSESNYQEAFQLISRAERYAPDDPGVKEWMPKLVKRLTILSDPPGADVFIKEYSDTGASWQKLGKTPAESVKMPVSACYRVKFEKPGYETVYAVTMTDADTLSRRLFRQATIPPGMVYVDEYWDEVRDVVEKEKGFFLDKFEVTNRQYKQFVDKGGYSTPKYWKFEFIKDRKKLTWEEAMAEFVDNTGRPGPSTWEAGDYPDGQDDFPVAGVSWYEAAAYAEFAGKELPTGNHWDSAVGFYYNVYESLLPLICPLSNFNGKGSVRVGLNQGMTAFGALDMAGNVREWCYNETRVGRIISGAGFADPTYLFSKWEQLPPFDRSSMNGLRCAIYINRDRIPGSAFKFIELGGDSKRDFAKEIPVPESTFRIYKNQFLYDKKPLNSVIEVRDESPDDWIVERVAFDAAYENQKMAVYLFLPKNVSPPFQTIIFFPGSNATYNKKFSEGHINNYLDYILKSGRAAVYPIYIGTYEREDSKTSLSTRKSHEYTELLIKVVKDFSRTIDYLETRADIDTLKLGFYGHSWGARMGAVIPAVEDRLKISILESGGFSRVKPYPEADEINYVSRVKIPTLMLNGRHDGIFPLTDNVMRFYRLLGTPEADKKLCIFEASHNIPKNYKIREILNWCDKYLGPVK